MTIEPVETLLYEINRLNSVLVEQDELKRHEMVRAMQDWENKAELRMSSFKQSQGAQAEVFELQIRKLREEIADQKEDYRRLKAQLASALESGESERAKVKEEVRVLLERKNAELYELRRQNEKKLKNSEAEREN